MSWEFANRARHECYVFLNAVRFFTRIHISDRVPHSPALLNDATRYFPAIGWLVGLVSAVVYSIAAHSYSPNVCVLLAMGASILITGAFHEDGLSDMADGLGGGWDKTRILEIMKDSRVGSYGVIAIVLTLLTKFVCLSDLSSAFVPVILVAGHAFSRYCAVLIMAGMQYVREDAQSKSKPLAKPVTGQALVMATILGLLPLLWVPFQAVVVGITAGVLVTIWLGRKLQKWLGGYTGDCLGAVQQLSEIAFYLGALAALG